jgi:hypothetical protein
MMSIAGFAIVHDDDRHGVLGDDARHIGVALQAPDVVDDARAGFERYARNGRLHAVDRDRHAECDDLGQDRRQPPQLLLARDRDHAAIGTGGFGTDIEGVGAIDGEPPGMLDCALRIQKAPAIGEAVRCDVDYAHDGRAAKAYQPRQRAGGWSHLWAGRTRRRQC